METDEPVVYFLEAVGLSFFKIGVTHDLGKRVAALQTGCPAEIQLLWLRRGGYELESHLHDVYASRHAYGEWFQLDDEIREVAAQHRMWHSREIWTYFLRNRHDLGWSKIKIANLATLERDCLEQIVLNMAAGTHYPEFCGVKHV